MEEADDTLASGASKTLGEMYVESLGRDVVATAAARMVQNLDIGSLIGAQVARTLNASSQTVAARMAQMLGAAASSQAIANLNATQARAIAEMFAATSETLLSSQADSINRFASEAVKVQAAQMDRIIATLGEAQAAQMQELVKTAGVLAAMQSTLSGLDLEPVLAHIVESSADLFPDTEASPGASTGILEPDVLTYQILVYLYVMGLAVYGYIEFREAVEWLTFIYGQSAHVVAREAAERFGALMKDSDDDR